MMVETQRNWSMPSTQHWSLHGHSKFSTNANFHCKAVCIWSQPFTSWKYKQTAKLCLSRLFILMALFNPIFSKDLFGWVPLTLCFAKINISGPWQLLQPLSMVSSPFISFMGMWSGWIAREQNHPDSQGTEPTPPQLRFLPQRRAAWQYYFKS